MSVEQSASTSAAAADQLDVAQELASVVGISQADISSYTAQNRRDYDGRLGTVTRSTASHGGALQIQVFFRGDDGGEHDTLLTVDQDRRAGLSEAVITFFGAIAATAPPLECISFVDEKL